MKKNTYKYAALAVIEEVLSLKLSSLRNAAEYTIATYNGDDGELSGWAKEYVEKQTAIANYIEDFIDKL